MGYMEAIKRPFSDLTKLVIGVILMLIPIVSLIGLGYYLQCAKQTFKKSTALPEWTGWMNLFITGLIATIIGIVWSIPTFVVAWLTIGTVLTAIAPLLASGGIAGITSAILSSIGTLMIGFAITAFVAIVFGLMGTVAMLRYAEKGKFATAFDFGAIVKVAFRSSYIAAWIVGVLYTLVLSIVLGIFVPYVGSAIAAFLTGVAMWTILAEAYKQ